LAIQNPFSGLAKLGLSFFVCPFDPNPRKEKPFCDSFSCRLFMLVELLNFKKNKSYY
jgi:hypothetical protein